MVLDTSLYNNQQYKVRINGKVEQSLERNRLIGLMGRVFANGPGNLGSIPGRVIPKTLEMVLDNPLLNT